MTPLVDKIRARSIIQPDGCVLWDGYLDKDGYATFTVEGKTRRMARFVWELEYGPMSPDLVPDHTCHSTDLTCPGGRECRHRACVNLDHLEPVTRKVNSQRSVVGRKERCDAGHLLVAEKRGRRGCPQCALDRRKTPEARAKRAAWARENRRRGA